MHKNQFFLITGCSGGGKSTLLSALCGLGYTTVAEPGRRIIKEQEEQGGTALPWSDLVAFSERAVQMARADLAEARGLTFFDRGLIDAAVALEHSNATPLAQTMQGQQHYAPQVFLAPPWPEIYESDSARKHGFDAALAEYTRIRAALVELRYQPILLPRTDVKARIALILDHIGPPNNN